MFLHRWEQFCRGRTLNCASKFGTQLRNIVLFPSVADPNPAGTKSRLKFQNVCYWTILRHICIDLKGGTRYPQNFPSSACWVRHLAWNNNNFDGRPPTKVLFWIQGKQIRSGSKGNKSNQNLDLAKGLGSITGTLVVDVVSLLLRVEERWVPGHPALHQHEDSGQDCGPPGGGAFGHQNQTNVWYKHLCRTVFFFIKIKIKAWRM